MAQDHTGGAFRNHKVLSSQLVNEIEEILRNLKHGSITLIVQDGAIIQIDTIKKERISRKTP